MLDLIVEHKKAALNHIARQLDLSTIERSIAALPPVKSLNASLSQIDSISVIAEIKRRSPSRGELAPDLSVEQMVTCYESGGARGISVLTESEFFGGKNEDLMIARHFSCLPILRKDFIIHEYQIWESRLIGADAILLIAAILDSDEIKRFASLASTLGLEVLFEVHTEEEIEKVGTASPGIIGINNRDLKSFTVDLATTIRLRSYLPDDVVCVSESGIKTRKDMLHLQQHGIDAVLIGEGIVIAPDPTRKIMELTGVRHDPH